MIFHFWFRKIVRLVHGINILILIRRKDNKLEGIFFSKVIF